jgi:hypothetical protein
MAFPLHQTFRWELGTLHTSFSAFSPVIPPATYALELDISITRWRYFLPLLLSSLLIAQSFAAEPVAVRRSQGTFHGFLLLKTTDGKTVAVGDLVQLAHGERVISRLTFHFHDGSLDDETAVFTQRKSIQFISDHHIQHGPSFPTPLDMRVDVASGNVTYRDKDGKSKQDHFDLTPDTLNGLFLPVLLNLNPGDDPIRVPMVVPTSKPRLAHVEITSDGEETVSIGGVRHKATNYRLKLDLGGIAGIVAPIIGKQPSDIHIWILEGDAPAFVRAEGQFYEGGPIWRIDLTSPVFSATQ